MRDGRQGSESKLAYHDTTWGLGSSTRVTTLAKACPDLAGNIYKTHPLANIEDPICQAWSRDSCLAVATAKMQTHLSRIGPFSQPLFAGRTFVSRIIV